MTRKIIVGAAQMGAIQLSTSRREVMDRMLALLGEAHHRGCDLVVFPELTLTSFFARHFISDPELGGYFEKEMPGPDTQPLFDAARRYGISFYLGYAEEVPETGERYNTAILVGKDGSIVGKYRKIHLPGSVEPDPRRTPDRQNFEKRYFRVGDLGFPVFNNLGGVMGMALCNDRRWPETYRVMGLQGVEMVMLGYNTGSIDAFSDEEPHLKMLQNHISMQAGAYQNRTWVVGVAKAGPEDGVPLMGGSVIISPSGQIVAQAVTQGDELITASCDLDHCTATKGTTLSLANRRPEFYGLITQPAPVEGGA
jgi:predicted amidohydrolase